jgi:dTDP-4-amino-4,6-dideoxygalactose transaminase
LSGAADGAGIPLTDVAWQHREVGDEVRAAFERLLADPTCDGAHFAHELEAAFVAHAGEPWIALSAQSGLAAETLLLRAWGIGPGDEVVTVPNSDLATTSAISHAGARFVLADVERDAFTLDPEAAESAITPRTRALMPVHMYGHPARMDALRRLADRHGLLLLEDATLALGAEVDGRPAGTLGDGAFFSFAPRKVLGGIGNGGMALVRDPEVARRFRLLRGYGLDPELQDRPIAERQRHAGQVHLAEGYNLKLDGIQAAIVRAKLRRLEAWNELRRAVAARYEAGLAGITGVETPRTTAGVRPAWRNYTLRVDRREDLRAHLHARGIATAALYTPPVHLQPVYAHLGLGPGSFPVAEAQAPRILCLPIYPGMAAAQVDRVVEGVRSFFEGQHRPPRRAARPGDDGAREAPGQRAEPEGGK